MSKVGNQLKYVVIAYAFYVKYIYILKNIYKIDNKVAFGFKLREQKPIIYALLILIIHLPYM